MHSDDDITDKAYHKFIESFLTYQRLFEYSGNVEDVLELPYCIFNDIINKQFEYKKKESEEYNETLSNITKNQNPKTPFKRR